MASKTDKIINQFKQSTPYEPKTAIATDMFIPNHSGITSHPEFKEELGNYVPYTGAKQNIDVNNKKITSLATPTATTDAVTKAYVDTAAHTVQDQDKAVQFNRGNAFFGSVNDFSYDYNTKTLFCKSITGNTLNISGKSTQAHTASTPARALNTTYQNTTGHPIIVYGSATCVFSDNLSADIAYFQCLTNAANPPTTIVCEGGCNLNAFVVVTNSVFSEKFGFFFVVQPNHYYRINSTATGIGSVTLNYWNEVNF